MGQIVKEMFAFLAIDDDGDEGVVSCLDLIKGVYAPMIAADQARVDSLRPAAVDIAKKTGKRITLARYHLRQDIDVIAP